LCRDEAKALSSLLPRLTQAGVPLVGVLHEKLGAEEFQPFLSAPLYLDTQKTFFGPQERRLGLLGFLRADVWMNIIESRKEGTEGNFKGDGTLLGGVYVIGPGDQGVLLQHQEAVWGDHVNTTALLQAVDKITKNI